MIGILGFAFFSRFFRRPDVGAAAVLQTNFDRGPHVDHHETILKIGITDHFGVNAKRFVAGRLVDAVLATVRTLFGVTGFLRARFIVDRADARLAERACSGNEREDHTYGKKSLYFLKL